MYKIKTLNSISPVIHDVLSAGQYVVSNEEPTPDAILVRSAAMHDMELPESLLAIARAGAGTNNIPIDKCSEKGIVVFNTPGANANAVAELVIAGLLLSSRDIAGGIAWVKASKDEEGLEKLVEKKKSQFVGPELRGKKLAVIGLGAIGALVANAAAQGLGMEVVGYDPYISVAHAWALSRAIHRADSMEDAVKDALKTKTPLEIINEEFIPALDEIGVKFEKGEVFLPRLIAAAEVVKKGMDVMKKDGDDDATRPDVILATVKGDIHDIGKNIVKMLLRSYGFKVLDLGKDVPENAVVDAWKKTRAPLIGLSALMTTTVPSMKATIDALKAAGSDAKIAVGGAVLTEEYAKTVGADFYGKDARATVKIAESVVRK